ncbi:MAG: MmgE/PrpD family protein, partial [Planctomycetota bacterium]|nr:MmgE/PrpD family protein [Planctomycetota bacterium]
MSAYVTLPSDTNQALGIGRYAVDMLAGRFDPPGEQVLARLEQFHLDSAACAVSAIACGTNAPTLLRNEALQYAYETAGGRRATCYGSSVGVAPEKAVVANCAAVREWDANGTNFGYNPDRGATAGEFGHNDFYPVAIAAAQLSGLDGRQTLLGMLVIDELRGRLAEVFSLKDYKIDHVLHGAIASAAVYGALRGATPEQIESALGLLVAHYIPFRAIRAGRQLSDSKGASAAISAEMAVLSVRRAMNGFAGPADVFRNPQAVFCLFQPPGRDDCSPFDLTLTTSGDDFAVMGMHFKLGLYEHQSAGAIDALVRLIVANPWLLQDPDDIQQIVVQVYEPAFGIICDPAKRDPRTRQSADHSMVYILATLLRKAIQQGRAGWKELMLMPSDYDANALTDAQTRKLMEIIQVEHGGPQYDEKYPDGIPTSVEITCGKGGRLSSGLVMYPPGHARNSTADLDDLLEYKIRALAGLGTDDVDAMRERFTNLSAKTAADIAQSN